MFTAQDRQILKQLAQRVHDIAQMSEQQQKRDMWRRHAALKHGIPPVFVSPEGSWEELIPPDMLQCEDAFARQVENELRRRIYRFDHIRDDTPIEDDYDVPVADIGLYIPWGIPVQRRPSTGRGAWHHAPIVEEPEDWKKLKKPSLRIYEDTAAHNAEMLRDAVGDLLKVHLTGIKTFDFHITHIYCDYRGLDNFYMDLIDEPEMVKDAFAFFTEGIMDMIKEAQRLNLIRSNNDYTYHYTGGLGYCDDLPAFTEAPVGLDQIWGAAEAQEYCCVSPEMFCETILPFEKQLLEPFGLNGYGCCDDLTEKLPEVLKIKNLRRVAACPWANIGKMAERLKKDYILTWKPNPAWLAGEMFDEAGMEKYMIESLQAAKCGYPEIILRDTHTCRSHPERFTKFVALARRAIENVYGE